MKLIKILLLFGIVICVGYVIACIVDLDGILNTPEEYIKMYDMPNESQEWYQRNLDNYLIFTIVGLTIASVFLVTNIAFYFTKNRKLRKSILIYDLIVFALALYRFISWWQTGFDS